MRLAPIVLLTLTVALAACAPSSPEPEAAPATAAVAAPAPAETAPVVEPAPAAAPTGLWFEPAALSACGSGKDVVTVHWDASAHPGVSGIQVVALESDGKEGMFADAPGTQGSKETGAWMGAGKTMVLRNAADGAELARASVESIPCP